MTILIDKTPYETETATKNMKHLPHELQNTTHMFIRHGKGLSEPNKIQVIRRMLWNTIPYYDDKEEASVTENSSPNSLLRSLL